jgi:hypothetical protein
MRARRLLSFRRGIVITVVVSILCSCQQVTRESNKRVSYGREIAPLFALHCNGCHRGQTPSSQFETATYNGLRRGGVLGDDIVPGFPDRSVLVRFIEGFRGPDQRMPLGSRPLTVQQIALIRRWISEGALNDHAVTSCYKLSLPSCTISPEHPLQISCKVSAVASLVLFVRDHNGNILFREEASIKQLPERMDGGASGQLLHWTVRPEATWPQHVAVELVIRYVPEAPQAILDATDNDGSILNTQNLIPSQCSPD